jgi:hypothetical protein
MLVLLSLMICGMFSDLLFSLTSRTVALAVSLAFTVGMGISLLAIWQRQRAVFSYFSLWTPNKQQRSAAVPMIMQIMQWLLLLTLLLDLQKDPTAWRIGWMLLKALIVGAFFFLPVLLATARPLQTAEVSENSLEQLSGE